MTRPEKPIDWEKVDSLLEAGCKASEICPHFNLHVETFYDRVRKQYDMLYTDYAALLQQKGQSCLRLAQYKKALERDNTMLIWLGKQRLGQRENAEQEVKSPREEILKLEEEILNLKNEVRKLKNVI